MSGSLRGWWRTTAISVRAAKLFWQDLLSRSTGGTRTRLWTPNRSKGEDTLSALEWGHSLCSWVRRPTPRLLGEDTHLAPGWGHPPCTLSGVRSMTCGLCLKIPHDSSWVPNAFCSRNWHASGTGLKAHTFRPIRKILQLTSWTTTLARDLDTHKVWTCTHSVIGRGDLVMNYNQAPFQANPVVP